MHRDFKLCSKIGIMTNESCMFGCYCHVEGIVTTVCVCVCVCPREPDRGRFCLTGANLFNVLRSRYQKTMLRRALLMKNGPWIVFDIHNSVARDTRHLG